MTDEALKINKTVTVIMPCRNEERYIERCLDSILSNGYPLELLRILVIDGRSTDGTKEIVGRYVERYPSIELLDNPDIIQTFATNIGLAAATSDIIIRMDAHAEYPEGYISKCVKWLIDTGSDCVGGVWVTRPGADTVVASAIPLALSSPFGVGNTHYRIGLKEPMEVDTVPYGCYRKGVFDEIGCFDEKLDRSDDLEFNLRLKRGGGKILLVPEIESYYYSRPTLKELFRQNYGNGYWIIYSMRFVKFPFSARHLVPLLFVVTLLASLVAAPFSVAAKFLFAFVVALYISVNLLFSLRLASGSSLKYLTPLLIIFPTLHFSYGIGSIMGFVRLFWAAVRAPKPARA